MSERIRVLIADDEPLIRRGLRSYLEDTNDIEVVGEASSGPSAVRLAHETMADVVLADLRMPGGSGIDATHKLTRPGRPRRTAVVAITTSDSNENIFGAIEHGASGVLLKTAQPHELADAVRAAARGGGYLAAALVPRVFSEFRRRRVPELAGRTLAEAKLSTREVELLHALTHGLSNDELAAHLEVSIGTVKGLFASIKRKLNLDERRHLVVWAFNNGLSHQPAAENEPETHIGRLDGAGSGAAGLDCDGSGAAEIDGAGSAPDGSGASGSAGAVRTSGKPKKT